MGELVGAQVALAHGAMTSRLMSSPATMKSQRTSARFASRKEKWGRYGFRTLVRG
jgi:hypothetical protein